ncbi:DNA polymerase III subunit alpha [Deinococcus soli (ex Cha et al. 2016)]|uniref:DNA polymerase-3 subunit alpha n=2 Tax=Deinococcus soli (ex Cha et al. 2016) TaxID=1309411 RepID=A0ACC6KJ62_9DEIO|nr:DNA polymerase III subunit alpha [Deinococcus soli (ex Cha et al. 2016)]MDR6219677.1 DNA polymerase-3 subunit alpha [Deinococcus soli (ex Cha et al. 2016)]MDR6329722.1 DNA polymerase-3 subunit alpha [Deinococcus soli (ex Cha et al. 2016)]MDR6752585.1 DNA polymerase-3 subunit alpha [Deinococcus soli (ex Cha et al. 2016)]
MTASADSAKPHIHVPDGSCCTPKKFAHLHQHTQYSLLDGAAKLKDLLKWAKEVTPEGQTPALAMTDHGNMHGAVHFYNYATGMGVKPIIGYEAYVVPGEGTRRDRTRAQDGEKGIFHLTLLARDFEGYQNLCRLSSRGYTEGYYYKPRIDHELLQEHHKGVIAFSGCLGSEVQQLLLQGREDDAKRRLLWYRELFGENYFIEIQDHGLPEQKRNNPILRAWAQELGIGMVATNDGHYVKKSDATAHETLLAIQTKATLADENRFKFPCDEFYVKNLEEMQASLPVGEWGEEPFDNTAMIAEMCNVDLPVGKKRVYQMPALPIPEGRTMPEELRVQTYRGTVKRYPAHATAGLLRDYAARTLTALGADAQKVLERAGGCDPQSCDLETLYTLLAFAGSEWEARGKAAGEKYTKYPALELMEAEADSGPLPAYAHEDCRRAAQKDSDTSIALDGEHGEETTRAHHRHALVILRRAEYELSVINNMGFPDYFLIVADYINWAKDQDISVGPGRGSGAGSLVAYAMRITNLDPLEFELLFERFLNPDRISMPDFDIDFNDARRTEVIQYVQDKYGEDKVAQIATFGTMASKACLKDVARVMGLEYAKVDKVSKLIPIKFGKSYSLEQAREAVPDIQQMLNEDAQLKEAYEFAQKLEGLTRHASVHAAGVVIGKTQLTDLVPVMRDTSGAGMVCQYDMKAVEDIGLIKMDFLGLRTLSFLDEAKRILKESGTDFEARYGTFDDIPFDDARTYELLSRGDTKGVFQLEGAGIADASRRLKPRRLADIIALSALYRPGPMENIPTYVRRHHGIEQVDYVRDGFPNSAQYLEKILAETYGIPVYQEQIMQIASEVAGFSLGGADLLRRAMGKKDAEEMKRQRQIFVEGAGGNGVPKDEGNKLFDLLDAFANYGFNKSHSAAYGVITYQTAWLKANYPVQFMAALLTVERKDSDKVAEYVSDARKMDVHVLPPDINQSAPDFAVVGQDILFGLYAIKGLGEGAVLKILEERERAGAFKSLADFCSRLGNKVCNRKAMESLIKSGAFDQFGDRRQLLESLEESMTWAQGAAALANSGMDALFGAQEVAPEPKLRTGVTPYTDLERLSIEKEALGLYISGHPLEQHEGLREAASCRISDLDTWFQTQNVAPGKRIKAVLAGMIESVVKKPTKSGGMMARFILADESGQTELVAFSRAYDRIQDKLINDTPALVIVELESEDGGLRAIAEEVVSVEQLGEVPKVMYVTIDLENATPDALGEFQSLLDEHAGSMPTYLRLETPEQFVLYQLDHGMGSSEAIRVLNHTFPWADAYLAYDQQTILGRFAPKPPAWMNKQNGGMRA